MSVNFMDVVAGDVVHLGGLEVVEIQTTGGRRFRILAGKHAGAKETRASALSSLTELFDCPTPIVEGVTEDEAEQIKRGIEKAHGSVKITRARN